MNKLKNSSVEIQPEKVVGDVDELKMLITALSWRLCKDVVGVLKKRMIEDRVRIYYYM